MIHPTSYQKQLFDCKLLCQFTFHAPLAFQKIHVIYSDETCQLVAWLSTMVKMFVNGISGFCRSQSLTEFLFIFLQTSHTFLQKNRHIILSLKLNRTLFDCGSDVKKYHTNTAQNTHNSNSNTSRILKFLRLPRSKWIAPPCSCSFVLQWGQKLHGHSDSRPMSRK